MCTSKSVSFFDKEKEQNEKKKKRLMLRNMEYIVKSSTYEMISKIETTETCSKHSLSRTHSHIHTRTRSQKQT